MLRVLVAAMHTFLAVTMATGGVILLLQARLDALWEHGFYGTLSTVTTAVTVGALLALAFAGFQLTASVGHAVGQRWGTWGLLGISAMLGVLLPPPKSWLVAGTAGVLVWDLWSSRPRPTEDDTLHDD